VHLYIHSPSIAQCLIRNTGPTLHKYAVMKHGIINRFFVKTVVVSIMEGFRLSTRVRGFCLVYLQKYWPSSEPHGETRRQQAIVMTLDR
jgi:hypothetical protein